MSDPVVALFALITTRPIGLVGLLKWWGGWAILAAVAIPVAIALGVLLDLVGAAVVAAP